jgi:hypothetical protein
MSLKIKAAFYTFLSLAIPFAIGLGLSQLSWWAVPALGIVFCIAIMYSLILTRLKFDSAVDEMRDRYK